MTASGRVGRGRPRRPGSPAAPPRRACPVGGPTASVSRRVQVDPEYAPSISCPSHPAILHPRPARPHGHRPPRHPAASASGHPARPGAVGERPHGYGGRMGTYAAVVLAGGAARRMGGVDKPALPVGGRPMRDRVLAAVSDATPRVLVGPADAVPRRACGSIREEPPGGGPVAAAAAGLALLDPEHALGRAARRRPAAAHPRRDRGVAGSRRRGGRGGGGERRPTGPASSTGTGGGSRSAVSGGSPRCGPRLDRLAVERGGSLSRGAGPGVARRSRRAGGALVRRRPAALVRLRH